MEHGAMEGGFALRPHYPARKIKGTDFPGETQSTELDFVKFGLPPMYPLLFPNIPRVFENESVTQYDRVCIL